MYSVSDAYKTKLHSSVHTTTLSGTIGSTSFTDADVLDLTITNQCSDTNEVSLGSVYTGELKMTLRFNFPISRTSWKNSTVTLSEGLKINSSITELVPLGVFIISECTFSLTGIDITAYDAMIKFDKAYSGIINGTPYSILSKACNKCGVVLKNTEYDFLYMTNGIADLTMYANNDIETYRDLISWVAATVCGFATISRDGKLEIRHYKNSYIDELTDAMRFNTCSFAGYDIHYTGLSVVSEADQSTIYYHVTPDDGSVYNMGSNPFLQGAGELAQNIINSFSSLELTPFKATILNGAPYDLGDTIKFSGGIASNALGSIMKYTYVYNGGYTMEGYGKDPALASARSKTDKNLAGLYSTVAQEVNQMTAFSNPLDISLLEGALVPILTYNFEATEENNLTFADFAVVMTTVAKESVSSDVYTLSDIVAHVHIFVDGTEITHYNPQFIVDEGKDTVVFPGTLSGLTVGAHELEVRLEVDGGTASIDSADAVCNLWGYGITFEVYVKAFEATAHRSTYYLTEMFSYDDNDINLIYNNGVLKDVTQGCDYEPTIGSRFTEVGEQTINVGYTDPETGENYSTSYDVYVSDELFDIHIQDYEGWAYGCALPYEVDYSSDTDFSVRYPTCIYTENINGTIMAVCMYEKIQRRGTHIYYDTDIVLREFSESPNTYDGYSWKDAGTLFAVISDFIYDGCFKCVKLHDKGYVYTDNYYMEGIKYKKTSSGKEQDSELEYRNLTEGYIINDREFYRSEKVYIQSLNFVGDTAGNNLVRTGYIYDVRFDFGVPEADEVITGLINRQDVRHDLMMTVGDYLIIPRVKMTYTGKQTDGGSTITNDTMDSFGFIYALIHDERPVEYESVKYADFTYVPDFYDTAYKVTEIYNRVLSENALSNANNASPFNYAPRNVYDYGKSEAKRTYQITNGELKIYSLTFSPTDYFTETLEGTFNTSITNLTAQGKLNGKDIYYFIDTTAKVLGLYTPGASPTYTELTWSAESDDLYKHTVSNIEKIVYIPNQKHYFYMFTAVESNVYKQYIAYSRDLETWTTHEGDFFNSNPIPEGSNFHINYTAGGVYTDGKDDILIPSGWWDRTGYELDNNTPCRCTFARLFGNVDNLGE